MRRRLLLVMCLALTASASATAAGAQAPRSAPTLTGAGFVAPPVAGQPSRLRLRAVDAQRAVSGVIVSFAGEGSWGASACRPPDSSGRVRGRPFRARAPVTFTVPHVFADAGPRTVLARFDTQGCSGGGGLLFAPFTATAIAPGAPPADAPLVAGTPVSLPGDGAGPAPATGGGPSLPIGAGPLVPSLPSVGESAGGSGGGQSISLDPEQPTVPVDTPGVPPAPSVPLPPVPGVPGLPATPLPGGVVRAAAASTCRDADLVPRSARTAARAARATLCLINVVRRTSRVRRLKADRALARVARGHSRAMVSRRFFGHIDPAGRDVGGRLRAAGWLPRPPTWAAGENVGFGDGPASTPRATVEGWYLSDAHRVNMLDPQFDRAGIGVAPGGPVPSAPGVPGATYTNVLGLVR